MLLFDFTIVQSTNFQINEFKKLIPFFTGCYEFHYNKVTGKPFIHVANSAYNMLQHYLYMSIVPQCSLNTSFISKCLIHQQDFQVFNNLIIVIQKFVTYNYILLKYLCHNMLLTHHRNLRV
jgi:hypothetical protein